MWKNILGTYIYIWIYIYMWMWIYITYICIYILVLVIQSCPTLCDPMDCSLSGSSVHGILQARILERVSMPSSRGSSQPGDWTWVSCITSKFFTIWATREAHTYIYKLRTLFVLLFSLSIVSNSLWPHGLQHARLPCPSPSPGVSSNSCPLSWWCYPSVLSNQRMRWLESPEGWTCLNINASRHLQGQWWRTSSAWWKSMH